MTAVSDRPVSDRPAAGNRWVAFGAAPAADPAEAVGEHPVPVPAGASRPQRSVPEPDRADRLPRRQVHGARPDWWWLGVHGGAGESSLELLDGGARAADHHWPLDPAGSTVVLVARSNVPGLRSAQLAATEWASGTLPGVRVAGLLVMADAPGRLPREIRDFARIVGGGVPHLWHLPWLGSWRLGHPIAPNQLPKDARTVLDAVRAAANAIAGTPAQ